MKFFTCFYLFSLPTILAAQQMQLCKIQNIKDAVLCGTYAVFENYKTKKGRKINLNIIVVPAVHKTSNQLPIFYFEGGPGLAATKNVSFFGESNNPYRQDHDIVLIDARGTGGSNPLNCFQLQYQRGIADQFNPVNPPEDIYPEAEVKACYDSLSKNADLTQYTTTNIANDIEEVRLWLGYKKIHLFGLSYGTRLAQEYMRRFPKAVQTVVLQSPTSTGSRMPLYHAKFAQASLDKLFEDCAKDSLCKINFPFLKQEFNDLMFIGSKQNFKTFFSFSDSSTKQLSIPWDIFQTKLRTLMYDPEGLKQIPFIIHQAASGNWKPFLSLYSEKGKYGDFLAEGLYLCITCSEDVPFIKSKEVIPLTRNTFMGTYRIRQQQLACANWARGFIPNDFLQPVRSNLPVLIISGNYDPVTPVSMARNIAAFLPNSQLVVIPQMSHLFDGLSNEECFDKMVMEFITNSGKSKVDTRCITSMQPPPYKFKN